MWFGWGQADASSGLRVVLAVGAVLAVLVAVAGAVQAFRSPPSDSTLHDRRAWRRYGLIVGLEFAVAGAGAAALAAAGQSGFVPVWVCAVVGVHMFPLASLLGDRLLVPLGVLLAAVALVALAAGLAGRVPPSTVTGLGAGCCSRCSPPSPWPASSWGRRRPAPAGGRPPAPGPRLGAFAGVCAVAPKMGSSCSCGPGDGFRTSWTEVAMSVYERDTEAAQDNAEGPPTFRMVRRGYDRAEVDAYIPQLVARLEEAVGLYAKSEQARAELQREVTSLREGSPSFEQLGGEAAALLQEAGRSAEQLVENARRRADTIIEKAQQQAEQIRTDVEAEAQKALEQAREVADHIRAEVEEERAALFSETDQVREFRDGLLDDLGRVHGEISGLLERTRTQRDQALTTSGALGVLNSRPAAAQGGETEEPPEPATVTERE